MRACFPFFHSYGKWIDSSTNIVYIFQHRYCARCNKIQRRFR